jgi:hypothetical protein
MPTNTRFGELLKEASKELDEELDYIQRSGKDKFTDLLESNLREVDRG